MDQLTPELRSDLLWEQAQHADNTFEIKIQSMGKNPKTIHGVLVLTSCLPNTQTDKNKMLYDETDATIIIPEYSQNPSTDGTSDQNYNLERQIAFRNQKVLSTEPNPKKFLESFFGRDDDMFRGLSRELARDRNMSLEIVSYPREHLPFQGFRLNFSTINREDINCTAKPVQAAKLFSQNFKYIFTNLTLGPYV